MNNGQTFAARTSSARRVLVLDPGALGDTVHLLPALWELRRHYAQAELHILSSPVGAEIISLAGCADRQWILPQSRDQRSLADQFRILSALRSLKFDVSINFGINERVLVYAGVIRAKHRLGRMGGRHYFWGGFCIPNRTAMPSPALPTYENHREMLASAGFSMNHARFDLAVPPEETTWAKGLLPSTSIHLSPNAQSPLREWSVQKWVELILLLKPAQPSLGIVVTGTADLRERNRLSSIQAAVNDRSVLFISNAPIAKLVALMDRCLIHVGSDSGALHVAVALGKGTVSFFRGGSPSRGWLPNGTRHQTFIKPCMCTNQKVSLCVPSSGSECIDSIKPDEVLTAIQRQLKDLQHGNSTPDRAEHSPRPGYTNDSILARPHD